MAGNAEQMIRNAKGNFLRKIGENPALIEKAMHTAHHLIKARWRKGVDRYGQPMAPYAPSTRRRKRRQGKPTSPANLIDSGQMIDSLKVRTARKTSAYKTRAELYLASSRARKLMRLHTRGAGRLPVRDVWGLTRREKQIIGRRFKADVARRIPRADRRKALKIFIRM